ncbi:ABC transporter substrate-binding protein [Chitinibacteraceae bacterium HSL-7]
MNLKRSVLAGAALFAATAVSAQAATKVEFWSHALAPKYDPYHKALVEKFNGANKDIQVSWQDVPWDAMQNRVITAVTTGNVPGLVLMPVPWLDKWVEKKLLTPVTKEIASFKGDFTPAAIGNATVDGQIYGFPSYQVTAVMFYNKDMMAKAGVNADSIKTLDDVFAASKQIKAKTGKPGWAPKFQDGFAGWFLYDGLPVIQGGKAVFNSPKHVALVEKFRAAYADGSIPKDAFTLDFDKQIAGYSSGSFAMFAEGAHAIKKVKDGNPKAYASTGVVGFPKAGGNTPFGGWGTLYAVPAGQKNLAAVVKVGQFITSDEAQLEFSKASGTFAATKKALQDPFFQAGAKSADAAEKALSVAASNIGDSKILVLKGLPEGVDEGALNKILDEAVYKSIKGEAATKAALDAAVAEWNKRLAK